MLTRRDCSIVAGSVVWIGAIGGCSGTTTDSRHEAAGGGAGTASTGNGTAGAESEHAQGGGLVDDTGRDDTVSNDDDTAASDDDIVGTDNDPVADDDAGTGAVASGGGSSSVGGGSASLGGAFAGGGSRNEAGATTSVSGGGSGGQAGSGGYAPNTTSCGDGVLDVGAERCDDGNRLGGDGCTEACQLEADHECPVAGAPCVSLASCGNGALNSLEACDDGNTGDGDGCAADCSSVELGWQCRVPGQLCVPTCGDGVVEAPEPCDDGNTSNGDGCSSVCRVEPQWSCSSAPSVCWRPVCGNGVVEAGESCDAGVQNGLFFGDASGCSRTCTREPSCRSATGETVRCSAVCGDGNLDQGEGCDDGNLLSGDGCSSACQPEPGFQCTERLRSDAVECLSGSGECLVLPIRFRDFDGAHVNGTGHPDFFYLGSNGVTCVPNASGVPAARTDGSGSSACWSSDATSLCAGLVASELGPNGKPVLNPASDRACACRFTDRDATGVLSGASTSTCLDGDNNAHAYVEDDVMVIESAESFAQWYSDSPKSTTVQLLLELERDGDTDRFTYSSSYGRTVYDDLHAIFMGEGDSLTSGFFPLETLNSLGSEKLCNLWPYWVFDASDACRTSASGPVAQQWDPRGSDVPGQAGAGGPVLNVQGQQHNFYFTSEVRYLFRFRGSERFAFFGNDDAWVFVNGRLVLDLGAPHERLRGVVTLADNGASADYQVQAVDLTSGEMTEVDDGAVSGLGLEVGGTYEIAVFHANRHPRASDYELTLSGFGASQSACAPICGDGVVTAGEECDDGALNSDAVYGGCRTDCSLGSYCGDGVTDDADEECDDGTDNQGVYGALGSCAPGCVRPHFCGDGIIDAVYGESCDDAGESATCTARCTLKEY